MRCTLCGDMVPCSRRATLMDPQREVLYDVCSSLAGGNRARAHAEEKERVEPGSAGDIREMGWPPEGR